MLRQILRFLKSGAPKTKNKKPGGEKTASGTQNIISNIINIL